MGIIKRFIISRLDKLSITKIYNMNSSAFDVREQLVLYKLNAFLEDDGYAHFSLDNLKFVGMGDGTLSDILKHLQEIGEITNCTVNGFYNRFKITNPVECPNYVCDDSLTLGNKIFIYNCLQLDNPTEKRSARLLAEMFGHKDYKHEALMLTQIKKAKGKTIFEFISDITPIKLKISNPKYPLVKKDNGYQVDSNTESIIKDNKTKRQRAKERRLQNDSIGKLIYRKIHLRALNNPGRFDNNTITAEELDKLYEQQDGKDYYTGLPFNSKEEVSADRIDCSKPYTKDNIVLTSVKINMMRHDLEIPEFIRLCGIIYEHFK